MEADAAIDNAITSMSGLQSGTRDFATSLLRHWLPRNWLPQTGPGKLGPAYVGLEPRVSRIETGFFENLLEWAA